MPKTIKPNNDATVGNVANTGNLAAHVAEAPAVSVEALRTSPLFAESRRGELADGLAAVLSSLARPAPAFLASMPKPGASRSALAPADDVAGTDGWPDAEDAEALVGRLHALLSSPGALPFFATVGNVPAPFYSSPRLGFVAGDTAADVAKDAENARRMGRAAPLAAPAGCARYECALSGEAFTLPLGAPVPALLLDTLGTKQSGPFDLAERAPLHPSEYVDGEFDGPTHYTVHPALVEAGPAHVLWAVWRLLESRLWSLADDLVSVCDLAAALSGVEPEALGVEWPARAYRRWEPVERPAEARTWKRTLAGVGAA